MPPIDDASPDSVPTTPSTSTPETPSTETSSSGAATTPQYVSREDFQTLQQQMSQMYGVVDQALKLVGQRGSQTAPAAPATISLDDLDQKVQNGEKIGPTVDAYINQRLNQFQQQHINPLQTTGLGAVAELTKKVAEKEMPYYQRYQKEIDGYVANLDPTARLNPQAYILAHNAVVGSHLQDILKDEREKNARGRRDTSPTGTPGGVARVGAGGAGSGQEPSDEEVFGREAIAAMAGYDPDVFAKKLGHKSWHDYKKFAYEQQGGSRV